MKMKAALGLVVVLVGCAAPSAEDDAVPDIDLTNVSPQHGPSCSSIPSLPVGTHVTDPNNPCDWSVREFNHSSTDDIWVVRAGVATSAIPTIATQALCQSSHLDVVVYGQRAPYYVFESGVWVYHPGGEWDLLDAGYESGHWSSSKCSFPDFQQQSGLGNALPIYPADSPSSPGWAYAKIRTATKSVLYAARTGIVSMTISTSFYPQWF